MLTYTVYRVCAVSRHSIKPNYGNDFEYLFMLLTTIEFSSGRRYTWLLLPPPLQNTQHSRTYIYRLQIARSFSQRKFSYGEQKLNSLKTVAVTTDCAVYSHLANCNWIVCNISSTSTRATENDKKKEKENGSENRNTEKKCHRNGMNVSQFHTAR